MMSNCNCHTGLIIDGSGQLGRYLKALDPAYAPIDDRSIEDLLVFAKRYAGQIRFYDIPGSMPNDTVDPEKLSWREFFRRDMAVVLASVATLDIAGIGKEYQEERTSIDEEPNREKFIGLFKIILGMAARMDRWYSVSIPENPLRAELDLAIDSHLRWQVQRIMAYEKGYKLIDPSHPLELDYNEIENDERWGLLEDIEPDTSIYEGSSLADQIRYASLYVDDIFNDFYATLQGFIDKGPDYMRFALESYPAHQPHMALYISFLQLFNLVQQQINGITERMLKFYYEEVLQLVPKEAIPDKVHVAFELANDITEYRISKGTALSAGKDDSGIDQVYVTTDELVVNQATVKELKTIFIETALTEDGSNRLIRNIYASPVANSADGFGMEFSDENPKWPTFGKSPLPAKALVNLCEKTASIKSELLAVPPAKTGFAIASPELKLLGGKRLIRLTVPGIEKLIRQQVAVHLPFEFWLTGEDGWLKIDKPIQDFNTFSLYFDHGVQLFNPNDENETSWFLRGDVFHIYLSLSEQAIIDFDPEIHTGNVFKTSYPVLQLLLTGDSDAVEAEYKSLRASAMSIEIVVGSINPDAEKKDEIEQKFGIPIPNFHFDGLQTLIIQNAEGVFEPGKPFNPFTSYPNDGKSLYIGSEEIFNKPVNELAVNILHTQQKDKTGARSSRSDPYIVSILANREWKQLTDAKGQNFNQVELARNFLNQNINGKNLPVTISRRPIESFTEWSPKLNKGFIRIDLDYQLKLKDNESVFQASQELATELEVKELSASYHSYLQKLAPEIDQVFHIYPFGFAEVYSRKTRELKSLRLAKTGTSFEALDSAKDNLLINTDSLFPQYTFPDSTDAASYTSAVYGDRLRSNKNILTELLEATTGVKKLLGKEKNQYSGKVEEQGILFIGIEKAEPLQSVSLLFQFAEGSAEDEDEDPPGLHWSYLTNNEWRPLKSEDLVSDGTYGFQATGIVKLTIPGDATANNTIVSEGLCWFSVSVTEHAERIPQLVNVITQAVQASFEDHGNDPDRFNEALEAGSITKLSVKVAEIKTVNQPFSSFDGKHAEVGKEFYTRVSERLRHKARAINSWDYEHLVLDRFPSVYKVKCITVTDPECLCRTGVIKSSAVKNNIQPLEYDRASLALMEGSRRLFDKNREQMLAIPTAKTSFRLYGTKPEEIAIAQKVMDGWMNEYNAGGIELQRLSGEIKTGEFPKAEMEISGLEDQQDKKVCCGPQVAPGHVLIIPVANLKNRNSINPLQPKTSRRTLLDIESYLKTRTSPFVRVHAKNPVYEQVIVGFKVQFYTGTDKGYYLKLLNEEIVHFLTPWAFDETAELRFGQKIYASSIINFIEERPYVDFITDFVMAVCKQECCPQKPSKVDGSTGGELSIDSDADSKELVNMLSEYPSEEVIISGYAEKRPLEEILASLCGCEDIDELLGLDPNQAGEIVAVPSTPRSILVSVPQHYITLYEKPERPSPCEERKSKKLKIHVAETRKPEEEITEFGTGLKAEEEPPGKLKSRPAKKSARTPGSKKANPPRPDKKN